MDNVHPDRWPRFDQGRPCPKCGYAPASAEFRHSNLDTGQHERLIRTCRGCGYQWVEHPLDYRGKVGS